MIINNKLNFILFSVLLVFIQFAINNLTIFYVDIIAIFLVSLLLNGNLPWAQLIIISFVGDLIGHWYLGSHLLVIVLLSFLTVKITNFYLICRWVPRLLIAAFYLIICFAMMYLIELSTQHVFTSLNNIIFQIVVILPIVQWLVDKLINRKPSEYF